ncbi:hypothetical protein [Thermosulfurimonas dismutans]|uniref:hypothetical protein n=1 Tax=Thermosulfurimonas dismutans TaxID=999894 RepID=UPI0012947496|nr:hypothetical protein [Thermosulfurimonas dismutans]
MKIEKIKGDPQKPILEVIIDNKYKVIYDTLDGFNWIEASVEENLEFFKKRFVNVDYYFKRSFSKILYKYAPSNCKIYPLGLNFSFDPSYFVLEWKYLVKNIVQKVWPIFYKIQSISIIKNKFPKLGYISEKLLLENFEFPPISTQNKVLFITRLFDPMKFPLCYREEVEKLNETRILIIRSCKKELKNIFTGGLYEDEYSLKVAKNLTISRNITRRSNFVKLIKLHNICISTTGLHKSIGWKFVEYVAASRAIITEPLFYQLPGNFKVDKNYLEFRNIDELLENIYTLLRDQGKIKDIMRANFYYYNMYVKPENLVLNTLLKIKNFLGKNDNIYSG